MNRDIEFRSSTWHWKMMLSMVMSYVFFTYILNWFTETEFQLWSFLITMTTMVVVYSVFVLCKKSHLSVMGNDVLLRGLKADLMAKRGMFGYQYIQITSNTETGYHRLKVTKNQVELLDWEFLLGKCI